MPPPDPVGGERRVLVLSDVFPNPARPAFGIWSWEQSVRLEGHYHVQAVVPVRVFPPLRLWQKLRHPSQFPPAWESWLDGLRQIPRRGDMGGLPVEYVRYTSPPRQIASGLWGFWAYPFVAPTLRRLHSECSFDLIHAHYATPSGAVALLASRWMRTPVVLSVHGADVLYSLHQDPASAAAVRWVLRSVDFIMANSFMTRDILLREGVAPGKVRVVWLGAEAPPRAPTSKSGSGRPGLTLLSVGYLEQRKGHSYVLRALQSLLREGRDLRYVVVGDGTEEARLHALATDLGIADRVSFEGYRAHDDVWPYYDSCDVFVLPSWNEAFGVAYIEALAMGKPVVGCESEGGPEDLRRLGDCVELVKPRDVDSLVAALRRLLDSAERRRAMGAVGRRVVREHFTWERTARETEAVYSRVLADRQDPRRAFA